MAFYTITRRYTSSIGGPWQGGEVVDLSPAQAAALDADSAGVCVPLVTAVPEAEPGEVAPETAPAEAPKPRRGRPSRDRMARGGQDR